MMSLKPFSPLFIRSNCLVGRPSDHSPPGPLLYRSSVKRRTVTLKKCKVYSTKPNVHNSMIGEVIVNDSHFIQPAEQKFMNDIVPLTAGDEMLLFHHISGVYFYKQNSSSSDFLVISSTLQDSLARTLVHFYPLAGRMIYREMDKSLENGSHVELHIKGGAVFIEAESNNKLEDFGDFSDLTKMKNLIPPVEQYDMSLKMLHKIPLLQVQLTTFRCGGYSLGIFMSHGVVDGLSATHFLKEWARIARGESLKTPPFMDRSVLGAKKLSKGQNSYPVEQTADHQGTDNIGLASISQQLEDGRNNDYLEKTYKEEYSTINFPEIKTRAILTLSKKQVNTLMNLAAASAAPNSIPYTRYEVITAYIWRCFAKTMGHDDKSEAEMAVGIFVDVRRRIQPPLPSKYFGNAIYVIAATSQAGHIISDQNLGYTCEKLRQAINHITDEYIRSHMIQDMKSIQDMYTRTGEFIIRSSTTGVDECSKVRMDLSVVSWLALPLYGLDFGFGKEICMRPGPEDRDAEIAIMSGQDIHQQKGQVDLIVCLPKDQLECFKRHFYEDIQC